MTAPTVGSNVEEITHKNIKFNMWDLGKEFLGLSNGFFDQNFQVVRITAEQTG